MNFIVVEGRVECAVFQYKTAPEVYRAPRADDRRHRRTRHRQNIIDDGQRLRAPLARAAQIGRVDAQEDLGRRIIIPQVTDQVDVLPHPFLAM